jgi:hypothetical protein
MTNQLRYLAVLKKSSCRSQKNESMAKMQNKIIGVGQFQGVQIDDRKF